MSQKKFALQAITGHQPIRLSSKPLQKQTKAMPPPMAQMLGQRKREALFKKLLKVSVKSSSFPLARGRIFLLLDFALKLMNQLFVRTLLISNIKSLGQLKLLLDANF